MNKQACAEWRFFRPGPAVVSRSSRPQHASCLSHHLSEGPALSGLNALVLVVALGLAESPSVLERPRRCAVSHRPAPKAASPAPTGSPPAPGDRAPCLHTEPGRCGFPGKFLLIEVTQHHGNHTQETTDLDSSLTFVINCQVLSLCALE